MLQVLKNWYKWLSIKHKQKLRNPRIPEMPIDLIEEILLNLPAESIYRFRDVCKSWLHLIESPVFIKAQVEITSRNKFLDNQFIVITPIYCFTNAPLYTVNFHSSENLKLAGTLEELNYPMIRTGYSRVISLVGTCNGLICLQDIRDVSFTVWNPSTGIYRILPDGPNYSPARWTTCETKYYIHDPCYYFGYDNVKNDYYLVKATDKSYGFVLSVYSLRNNSWTMIDNQDLQELLKDSIIGVSSGAFIGTTLYMISRRVNNLQPFYPMIIAFDISTHTFKFVQLPSENRAFEYSYSEIVNSILSDWSGRLCVLDSLDLKHVWLMNDDHSLGGIEEQWIRYEFKISRPLDIKKLFPVTWGESAGAEGVLGIVCAKYNDEFSLYEWLWYKFDINGKDILLKQKVSVGGSPDANYQIHSRACVCLNTVASPFLD